MQRILFATDFSEQCEAAFPLARALARSLGAGLTVVHVATPPPLVSYGELSRVLDGLDGLRRELMDRLQRVTAGCNTIDVEHLVVEGDPAGAIMRVAADRSCDLIVMGSHGQGGLGRVLTGSVADAVLRHAACPVAIVKQARRPAPTAPLPSPAGAEPR